MSNTADFDFADVIFILISGKAGTGKTTSAEFISKYLDETLKITNYIVPFAKSLKFIARAIGWDGNKDSKGRRLLIDLGAVGRAYNENCWVIQTLMNVDRFYADAPIIIIDDWRFPNEYDYLKNTKGLEVYTIRINSPERELLSNTEFEHDLSENALPSINSLYYNYFVQNTGTLETLNSNCKAIISDIIKKSAKWE